ncbi:hypothetical protein SDC9_199193 [bioreactor metagenome]|uniref:Uncharacterized protein n=1 Tax=bioreactor metagenome TaxID=1076179 RepID=A0A645IJS9_9ZZZZ
MRIHCIVETDRLAIVRLQNKLIIIPDIQSSLGQVRIVGAGESAEVIGIHLGGTIPAHQ